MYLLKAFLFTLGYYAFLSLIGLWVLLPYYYGGDFLLKNNELITNSILVISLAIMYRYRMQKGMRVRFKAKSYWFLLAIVLGFVFVFTQGLLRTGYNTMFSTNYPDLTYTFNLNVDYWYMLSSVILVPFSEELFFRGVIQEDLQRKTSQWTAILVTAGLFALIHVPYLESSFLGIGMNWFRGYIVFFGGLIACILYNRSGALGPSLVFHAVWNFTVNFF